MSTSSLRMGTTYDPDNKATLATMDCLQFLKTIPDGEAQLLVTSPPYNIGKKYEESVALETYRRFLKDVVKECVRIVRPGGSICFQVGNYMVGPSRPRPIAFLVDPIFHRFGHTHQIRLRNVIIWHFGHGLHAKRRFSGRYEMVLWYTKGDDYLFDLDAVRVPQKYPGKRYFKGKNKGKISGNPAGKNPGDVWLDIPNVKANHVEKTDHPCQFPVGLVQRLILALTKPDDLVVDPFMGTGQTAVAGLLSNRRVAGCDRMGAYTIVARKRARQAWAGELKVRSNGPVYEPTGRESVSRVPGGFWLNFGAPISARP